MVFLRQILTDGDSPGVVGRSRGKPDELILFRVQLFDFFVSLLRVFPRRVVLLFEEERAVAGIFRVNIQLTGGYRPAHHRRGAELDFIDGFHPMAFQNLQNNIAEQRPFGVNF